MEANYNGVWVRAFKDLSGKIIAMSVDEDLKHAETLLESGAFDQAFQLLGGIVSRTDVTEIELADAYHLLGTIVQVCPRFGTEDECGLSYFRKALEHVPKHIWALYGVVATYGEKFPDHQEIESTRSAILQLEVRLNELPIRMQALVREKHKLLDRVLHSNQ